MNIQERLTNLEHQVECLQKVSDKDAVRIEELRTALDSTLMFKDEQESPQCEDSDDEYYDTPSKLPKKEKWVIVCLPKQYDKPIKLKKTEPKFWCENDFEEDEGEGHWSVNIKSAYVYSDFVDAFKNIRDQKLKGASQHHEKPKPILKEEFE